MNRNHNRFPWILAIIGVILVGIIMVAMFISVIPEGNVGVVVRLGQALDTTLPPGPFFKNPLINVVNMDTRYQKYKITTAAFSKDMQQVDVSLSVSYALRADSALNMFKTVGKNYEDAIIAPQVLESIKDIIGQYSAEQVVSARSQVSSQIAENMREGLDVLGINIRDVSIENLDFSDAFEAAIEAKQVATQRKLQTQTEQEQATLVASAEAERARIAAEAEAERTRISAQAKADAIVIAADAEAYRLEQESKNVTGMLIYKTIAERWNGQLPTMLGGGNPLIDVTSMLPSN